MSNRELFEKIFSMLNESYELVYVDYRDELSESVLDECITSKDIQPALEATDEWYFDNAWESAKTIVRELYNEVDSDEDDEIPSLDDFESSDEWQELIEAITYRDKSDYVRELFNNSEMSLRLVLESNYEAISDAEDEFSCDYGYLSTMIDLLNLNPFLVKKEGEKQGYTMEGEWENKIERNGREIISYEDVFRFIKDCWYHSQLTFTGKVDMDVLYEALLKGSFDDIVIGKDTPFIAFSSWQGFGGENIFYSTNSFRLGDMKDKGKTKYDSFYLVPDGSIKKHGYTIYETYGGDITDEYLF